MSEKTYIPAGEQGQVPASQIGATLEALAGTIHARRDAGDESYTHRLLTGNADSPLKKVVEESNEVALAAKDVEAGYARCWRAFPVTRARIAGMAEAFAASRPTRLATICATRPPTWCTIFSLCLSATASASTSSPPS